MHCCAVILQVPTKVGNPLSKTWKPSRPGSESNCLLWTTTTSLDLLLNALQNTSSVSHSQPVNILSLKMSLNTTNSQNSLWLSNTRNLSPFWNFVYLCFFFSAGSSIAQVGLKLTVYRNTALNLKAKLLLRLSPALGVTCTLPRDGSGSLSGYFSGSASSILLEILTFAYTTFLIR